MGSRGPGVAVDMDRHTASEWTDKIHVGDCLEVMAKIPAESVDLVVTSPPYNLRQSSGGGLRSRSSHWANAKLRDGYDGGYTDDMPRRDYITWQRDCLTAMMRLLKDTGAIFYNHKWRVQNGVLEDQKEIVYGFPVRQIIIWQRAGGINFNLGYYLPTYEVIYLITKSEKFRLADENACRMGDIWTIPQDRNNDHPASFPIAVPKRCIESTSAHIVLDPFMGSGTTALAAEKLMRSWIGIERAQSYVDQANKRMAEWRAVSAEERKAIDDVEMPKLLARRSRLKRELEAVEAGLATFGPEEDM